jgi:hypothetical protein
MSALVELLSTPLHMNPSMMFAASLSMMRRGLVVDLHVNLSIVLGE